MPRYVALLRAVNVGGRVVKMDRLRALFEALKLRNVETVIASGNVLFDAGRDDAAALERRIERHLERALGFEVATFVRTAAELAAVAAYEPFAALGPLEAGRDLWIGFLSAPPTADVERAVLALATDVDRFRITGRELYWRRLVRNMESLRLGARLERVLGVPMTMRNATTVRKLAERAPLV